MKKLLSVLLVLMMLCAGAAASDAGDMSAQYDDCIIRLNDYLLNAKDVEVDLDLLKADFDALGNYDNGNAALFALYTQVLIGLRDVRYAECEAPLYMLNLNAEKINMILLTYPDLYALGDIPTLEKYCDARMCEVQGDYAQALSLYSTITFFYDSMSRATNCLGHTSTVLTESNPTEKQNSATPAPAPQGTITLSAYTGARAVNMTWTATSGLKNFKVYRRCDSRNKDWELINSTESKEYKDFQIVTELYYTYYVEGTDAQGRVVRSNELQIFTKMRVAADNSDNGNSNTNTNDNSTSNENQNTSSNKNDNTTISSSSASSSSDNTNQNINNVTQNVTVIVPTEKPAQWSAWSAWSTTPVSSSSTREIETKLEYEPIYVTKYHYRHWKYYNLSAKTYWYSYAEYTGSDYKSGSGKWEYKTTTTPLEKSKVVDGRQQYTGYWFLYDTTTEQDGTKTITYYRYRDRIN